jgi:hypothetical protein
MPEPDRLLVQDVRETLDLVLLVVEERLKGHNVGAHHVAGGEAAGVEDGPLGKDDAAAVGIALRQHEHVAHADQLAQMRILETKIIVNILPITSIPPSPPPR